MTGTWMLIGVAITLAGCTSYLPEPEDPKTITVKVIATQPQKDCAARFPAQQNACRGVTGETDGLACGAQGDRIVWKPGNPVTGISAVNFTAGNAKVCGRDDLREPDGSYSCVLQPRPPSEGQGLAFKYVVDVTFRGVDCEDTDPYVIIVRR